MRSAMRTTCVVVGLLVTVSVIPARAEVMGWTFQRIVQSSSSPSSSLAMAMRTGATWPVVLADSTTGYPYQVVSFGLTPAGWMAAPLGGSSSGYGSFLRAEAGSDGRVAAAWQSSNQIFFAQATGPVWQTAQVGSLPSSSSAATAPDVDYLSGHRPVVGWSDQNAIRVAAYDGLVWNYDTVDFPAGPVPDMGTYVSLATDSADSIGVAYANGSSVFFAMRSPYGGTWSGASVLVGGPTQVRHLALAFGPNDEPGLSILFGTGDLGFATFNIQRGEWQTAMVASGITSARVSLAYNSLGQPALAYQAGPTVHYRINDGGGWQDYLLPIGIDVDSNLNVTPATSMGEAALAFDANDLPVIAYYAAAPGLLLAYDPVVVPEPAAVALFGALAGLMGFRRRRR